MAEAGAMAKLVKAIPTFAGLLHSATTLIDGRRTAVFVCGDDPEANMSSVVW